MYGKTYSTVSGVVRDLEKKFAAEGIDADAVGTAYAIVMWDDEEQGYTVVCGGGLLDDIIDDHRYTA